MNKEFVTRNYSFNAETRDDEEKGVGIIEGCPIVFEQKTNLGYFDEVIKKGALDKADLKDVRLCLNHDTSYVYARSRNNNENSTMQLKPHEKGMDFRAELDIKNSPKSQDYYSAVKRKDIDKMSFMFTIDEEEWVDLDTDHPTRYIKSIGKVLEISAVTFPAYDGTEISARDKNALDNAKAALDSAKTRSLDRGQAVKALELEKAKNKNKIY